MIDRELMQQSLDLLEDINQCSLPPTGIFLPAEIDHVMEALRARLAQPETYPENFIDALRYHTAIQEQPEPEPVAWCIVENGRVHGLVKTKPAVMNAEKWQPLFTAQPQREWVGLTDEDREWCDEHSHGNTSWAKQKAYGRAIEAKLKEKNCV